MEHDNQTIRQFLCPFGFEPPDYVWKKMHLRTVPAKAVLVLAGSNLNAIDILLQGEIHVVNSFSDGKEFGLCLQAPLLQPVRLQGAFPDLLQTWKCSSSTLPHVFS